MTMKILKPAEFQTAPWKNGGGITHEIAKAEDAQGLIWRLSIAEVASDGPFSAFVGLSRILTVIEGSGLVLDTPDGPLVAELLKPLAFSGDLPVTSRMVDGPIRDFNVIYDAARVRAKVAVLRGPQMQDFAGEPLAVLALGGRVLIDGKRVAPGEVGLVDAGQRGMNIASDVAVLVVQLTPY
ncbi:MAG: HutD family protein [Rhodobacterales bacterium]|jgi:uncharacterized protein|nr:HutD family protein [Pseudomonadota bacterium]MDA1284962.1 HutD family protein [Pseudomonadota bacterium]HBN29799.1 hypothetical protein [Paracoccaceae bacterium]